MKSYDRADKTPAGAEHRFPGLTFYLEYYTWYLKLHFFLKIRRLTYFGRLMLSGNPAKWNSACWLSVEACMHVLWTHECGSTLFHRGHSHTCSLVVHAQTHLHFWEIKAGQTSCEAFTLRSHVLKGFYFNVRELGCFWTQQFRKHTTTVHVFKPKASSRLLQLLGEILFLKLVRLYL